VKGHAHTRTTFLSRDCSLLSFKKKDEAYEITSLSVRQSLCVFPPLSFFNHLVGFIKFSREKTTLTPASATPKWRMFRLLRWLQNFHQQCCAMKLCILVDLQRMNNFK
jgi:hypothetical protein